MTFAARQAEPADLALVESITNEAYAPYVPLLGSKPLPMDADYAARIAAGQVWLVDREGAGTVGLLVLELEAGKAVIFSLAVVPGQQGTGTGQWMLQLAEDRARLAGAAQLTLYTSSKMERNIGIYRQAGFVETGRRPNPYRPGWILVDMARPIPSLDD